MTTQTFPCRKYIDGQTTFYEFNPSDSGGAPAELTLTRPEFISEFSIYLDVAEGMPQLYMLGYGGLELARSTYINETVNNDVVDPQATILLPALDLPGVPSNHYKISETDNQNHCVFQGTYQVTYTYLGPYGPSVSQHNLDTGGDDASPYTWPVYDLDQIIGSNPFGAYLRFKDDRNFICVTPGSDSYAEIYIVRNGAVVEQVKVPRMGHQEDPVGAIVDFNIPVAGYSVNAGMFRVSGYWSDIFNGLLRSYVSAVATVGMMAYIVGDSLVLVDMYRLQPRWGTERISNPDGTTISWPQDSVIISSSMYVVDLKTKTSGTKAGVILTEVHDGRQDPLPNPLLVTQYSFGLLPDDYPYPLGGYAFSPAIGDISTGSSLPTGVGKASPDGTIFKNNIVRGEAQWRG